MRSTERRLIASQAWRCCSSLASAFWRGLSGKVALEFAMTPRAAACSVRPAVLRYFDVDVCVRVCSCKEWYWRVRRPYRMKWSRIEVRGRFLSPNPQSRSRLVEEGAQTDPGSAGATNTQSTSLCPSPRYVAIVFLTSWIFFRDSSRVCDT